MTNQLERPRPRVHIGWTAACPIVTLEVDSEALLAAVILARANDARVRNHQPPSPLLQELAEALGFASRVDEITSVLPAGQAVDAGVGDLAGWVTTAMAASIEHVGEDAIRKRIRRGRLPSRRLGRKLLVHLDDLHRYREAA